MLDTAELKGRVDIQDLAGRYAELRKWSGAELAGPCPKCGGADRFHVNAEGWFKCYQCHPKRADVVELVQFLGLAGDFKEAARWLQDYAGGALASLPTPKAPPTPAASAPKPWPDPDWQRSARAKLAAAVARLAGPAGDPGRAYLAGRGLQPETWQAWGLGFDPEKWDPAQERKRPAIVIPWHWGAKLCALKYRFLDSKEKGDRFTSKGGGEQRLFGLQMRQPAGVLILIEGELNALSVWQAARAGGLCGLDVVSFGAEAAGASRHAADLAARYGPGRVIVWSDEENRTRAALANIPGALGKRSPYGLDANDLLRAGRLATFLRAILAELPAASAIGAPPVASPTPAAEASAIGPAPTLGQDLSAAAVTWAPPPVTENDAYTAACSAVLEQVDRDYWRPGLDGWLQTPAGQELAGAIGAAEARIAALDGGDLGQFAEACAAWAELHKQAAAAYAAELAGVGL